MKNILLIGFTLLIFSGSAQTDMENDITKLFTIELEKSSIRNGFLKLYSNSKSINIQLSEGIFSNGNSVSNETPFYTASIGKIFTATAIAILKDQGELDFEDSIGKYLPNDIISQLHVVNGEDNSYKITIAQLLQHTSGLPDYFEDTTIDGSPNIIMQLFMNPNKIWTPTEVLDFTKHKMKPLFLPGESYHYTDTEYILLGLIVENISGLKLHEFFKQHMFSRLNMIHTYLNLKSEPIAETSQMAEVFAGNQDVSGFKSLSADWAGGGIISTASDLILFQEALFTQKLLTLETLTTMQQWIPEAQGMYYGFGLRKIVFNELHPDLPTIEVIGHSGSTGSFLYYCPSLDTYISGTLNQTDEVRNSVILVANILEIIKKSN